MERKEPTIIDYGFKKEPKESIEVTPEPIGENCGFIAKDDKWIYGYDDDKSLGFPVNFPFTRIRYILGGKLKEKGNALICIGINPSTATPGELDPTLTKIRKYAEDNGYRAWYMLNVLPYRSTDPKGMPEDEDSDYIKEIHKRNIYHIKKLVEILKDVPTVYVWCAWGSRITTRKYLKTFLKDIVDAIPRKTQKKAIVDAPNTPFQYVQKIAIDKAKQPRLHPLHPIARIATEEELEDFDIAKYIET